jgi:hypothetical protein
VFVAAARGVSRHYHPGTFFRNFLIFYLLIIRWRGKNPPHFSVEGLIA